MEVRRCRDQLTVSSD